MGEGDGEMTSCAHQTLTAMHSLFSLLALVGSGLAISIEDSGIVCKEEGFHPHPSTCAKFYRCVRWSGELELVLFQCAPGTIWLPGDTVCAHLEGDACQIGQTSKAPSTTEATTAATTPATTTQAPTNTGASKCARSGLVAHGDCHHFWLCFWVSSADIIEPHLYRCPDGEIFSVNGHKCAPESESHTCQPSEIPPPDNVPVNQLDPAALLRSWGVHTVQQFPWLLAVF